MIEIQRNGNGRMVVSIMDIVKIGVFIIGGLFVYFSTVGDINTKNATQDVQIERNCNDIAKHESAIGDIYKTKADKE